MLEKSSKGFLGPIGDDLPSLIPLIFALTIFFSVFSMAWNSFDAGNKDFEDKIAVLGIASTIKGNSYISDFTAFQGRCLEAKGQKRVFFKAGLLPLYVKEDRHFEGIDISDPEFFEDPNTGNVFECTNATSEDMEIFRQETINVIVRFFPIALEHDYKENGERHYFIQPMLLVVIAW